MNMPSLHNQRAEHHEVTSNANVSFSADPGLKSSPAIFYDSCTFLQQNSWTVHENISRLFLFILLRARCS